MGPPLKHEPPLCLRPKAPPPFLSSPPPLPSPPSTRRLLAGKDVVRGVNYAGIRLLKEAGDISEEHAEALEGGLVVAPSPRPVQSAR